MMNRWMCGVAILLALSLSGCQSGGAHAHGDACKAPTCKGCNKEVACGDEMMKCSGCNATMKCGDMMAKCGKCGASMKCSEVMGKDKAACCGKDGKGCCKDGKDAKACKDGKACDGKCAGDGAKSCTAKCPKCGGEMKCDMNCGKCGKAMVCTGMCSACCAKPAK